MDYGAIRDILFGGGSLAFIGTVGVQLWKRFVSDNKAGVAGSDATARMIERLEEQLIREQVRADSAVARADTAERERNESLIKIDRLTYTVQRLSEEVEGLKKQMQAGAPRANQEAGDAQFPNSA